MADHSLGRNTRVAMPELSGMSRLRFSQSTPKLGMGRPLRTPKGAAEHSKRSAELCGCTVVYDGSAERDLLGLTVLRMVKHLRVQ
jgi:hypothetical protein